MKTKKKLALIFSLLLGLAFVGCGSNSNPEIIMPDSPMTSVEDVPATAADKKEETDKKETADAQEDTEKENTSKAESSGENYLVYLITMDLTDSYWQSIDAGCKEAVK